MGQQTTQNKNFNMLRQILSLLHEYSICFVLPLYTSTFECSTLTKVN